VGAGVGIYVTPSAIIIVIKITLSRLSHPYSFQLRASRKWRRYQAIRAHARNQSRQFRSIHKGLEQVDTKMVWESFRYFSGSSVVSSRLRSKIAERAANEANAGIVSVDCDTLTEVVISQQADAPEIENDGVESILDFEKLRDSR